MKTPPSSNGVIKYASHSDYLKKSPASLKSLGGELAKALPTEKVDVSNEAKGLSGEKANPMGNPKGDLKDEIKEKAKEVPKKIKDKVIEGKSAGEHLLNQAGGALIRAVTSVPIPGISPSLPGVSGPSQIKTKEVSDPTEKVLINKPGIYFVKGFSINPFENPEDGLGEMAKNIPGAEIYSWSDKDSLIDAIKTRPHSQPLILVGHGMGGDTAVDVANSLNSVEHGFRRVDLMVTMDSIGTDNDIIPQNVRENLNLISDQDMLFNDGPNVARKKTQTRVTNELLTETHSQMETSPETQFLVYDKINTTLLNAISRRDFKEAMTQKIMDMHRLPSPETNPSVQNQA